MMSWIAAALVVGAPGYALVVGHNLGGKGQGALKYAEADARRVADTLSEVAGYGRDRVRVLASPGRTELIRALDDAKAALAAEGGRAVFLFYYSGHARANALNLGADELPLAELRERLVGMPAALQLVVLDACQSGAFSRPKGAAPAADFSFNSVTALDTEGIAIMASSSAAELSQESEKLGGSYFSHHLLAGLRGAADANHDGLVSLSEAYRYAYHATLISTAETAIGGQHVTLETDLEGRGDVILSRPEEASAHLELPAGLEAEVIVSRPASETVMAELHKVAGEPMRLALTPGRYQALVRVEDRLRRCELELVDGGGATLAPASCPEVPLERGRAKGVYGIGEGWALELGLGYAGRRKDDFDTRLGEFGFAEQLSLAPLAHWSVTVVKDLSPWVSVSLGVEPLEFGKYRRTIRDQAGGAVEQRFTWDTYAISAHARGRIPLADWFVPYVQLGAGGAWAVSDLAGDSQVHGGFVLSAHAGAYGAVFRDLGPIAGLGYFSQIGFAYAPVVENLLGDRHDSGGVQLQFGLRFGF